ncbi:hypothetical protein QJS66_08615 [Kocuria rhizophila]|nr:hypothetical protein QJS66_08615 [Kocuria rhizophila]
MFHLAQAAGGAGRLGRDHRDPPWRGGGGRRPQVSTEEPAARWWAGRSPSRWRRSRSCRAAPHSGARPHGRRGQRSRGAGRRELLTWPPGRSSPWPACRATARPSDPGARGA